jgi:hypothetical protein
MTSTSAPSCGAVGVAGAGAAAADGGADRTAGGDGGVLREGAIAGPRGQRRWYLRQAICTDHLPDVQRGGDPGTRGR